MQELLHILLNATEFLEGFIRDHGVWVYGLLFAVVFCETGLVVTPFLPGDSLLFTVGALAARGSLNIWIAAGLLFAAAILGNTSNYWIGRYVGPRVFRKEASNAVPTLIERVLNRKHLDRAHGFFEKYGGKAVMLGQFVPIVRTFCPFVAGAGSMSYGKFIFFNIAGALLWVGVCCGAGWFFGNIEFVKKHFELVVLAIIGVSVIPVVFEFVRSRRRGATESA